MAYNKAKEEYRWNQWKAEEETILREQGVDEETIQKLREYDPSPHSSRQPGAVYAACRATAAGGCRLLVCRQSG